MSKLQKFKRRAARRGQTVSLYAFSAWPTGDYVDTWSGEPDPDDVDYPATVPEPTYETAVSVTGFFQPATAQIAGASPRDQPVRAPWGEEVQQAAIFYCPGDQEVSEKDKVVYGSDIYYVYSLSPRYDGSILVHTEVYLTESVPKVN